MNIQWEMKSSANCSVTLINMQGLEVANIFQGNLGSGKQMLQHQLDTTLSDGLYLVKIVVGEEIRYKKVVIKN